MDLSGELFIGILGMAILLVAFFMNQIQRWTAQSLVYDFTNFLGSGLMVYYSWLIDSIPFLVLNVVWGLVSLKDVVTTLATKKK